MARLGNKVTSPTSGKWHYCPAKGIIQVFCPDRGLTQEPPVRGKVLITTNQRILAFSRDDDRNDTYLVPIEELKGVAVKTGDRSYGSLFQGLLLIIGGIFLYLVVAYWWTGQFTGPSVPVLNIDAGPLMVLLVVLIGLALIWPGTTSPGRMAR